MFAQPSKQQSPQLGQSRSGTPTDQQVESRPVHALCESGLTRGQVSEGEGWDGSATTGAGGGSWGWGGGTYSTTGAGGGTYITGAGVGGGGGGMY